MNNCSVKRVVLLSDEYIPKSTRNHAKMMHQLAVKFVKEGKRAVVITPGTLSQESLLVTEMIDGVEIWRFRSADFRAGGKVYRAFHESIMPLRALLSILFTSGPRSENFDICVNYSPSIFFSLVASFYRKRGSFVFLILRDFFPQWIIDEGIISARSLIAKYFKAVERHNYRSSHVIALQSPANISVFKEKIYREPARLSVVFNWAEYTDVVFTKNKRTVRQRYGLEDKVIFFYGGNIGHAQDMMNIVNLAHSMKECSKACFLLVGQGDEYNLVKEQVQILGLDNLLLLPSVSQSEYLYFLEAADIGLISLSIKHKAHNFPGKILGYMSAGLPILGSVNNGNDLVDVINSTDAGLVSYNGDSEAFLEDAIKLYRDELLRDTMGEASSGLLRNTFSVESAYERIVGHFDEYVLD